MRQTTGSPDPEERLWVYHRTGQPCRQCGATILSRKQGIDARTSFWCPVCQPMCSKVKPGQVPDREPMLANGYVDVCNGGYYVAGTRIALDVLYYSLPERPVGRGVRAYRVAGEDSRGNRVR
jgi:hypothetical protein